MFTKEEILKEIKRTAHKGKALGYTSFRNKTSIRSWDWNRYWSKWGDAVAEAGLAPNLAWTKHKEGVLEKDASYLIRKLGKYPTKNEMRLEFVNNPKFHYSAINKKRKDEFIKDLIAYCEKHSGYDDILKICRPMLRTLDKKEIVSNIESEVGEVYLARHGTQKHYKIGFTKDVMRRGKEISVLLPEKLKLIHSIKTDDPSGVESYWHNRFKNKRMQGEWFELNSQDVKDFKRWKKIY